MSLRQQVQDAVKIAMKERKEAELSTLRLLWSQIKNVEIDKKHELSDEEIQEVASRTVKQLKDSLQDFVAGKRDDLVEKTKAEINLLETFLPRQLSDEELENIIREIITKNNITDAGRAMGLIMKEIKGQADGVRVKEVVSRVVNNI